ncbi:hypothetical protein OS493_029699 [Desmophyllum pertusum]|uniref:Transglutaminase N-terminal domain-containing protein n=1 Tax=Desmophyllum pertusum TaxID=174260 RepID=A0A9X0CVQ1_9CNID|nr:hypothetical protein OS493_029699 [Desmophyllum pertusum]
MKHFFTNWRTDPVESRREQECPDLTHERNNTRILKEQEAELKAVIINFHIKENSEAHNTDQYEVEHLILKRGQAFDITVKFNRAYNPQTDFITLQFATDKNPHQNEAFTARVEIQDVLLLSKWGMQVKEASGNTVCLSVMSSAQAMIGCYDVKVETKRKGSCSGEISQYRCKNGEQIWFMEDS